MAEQRDGAAPDIDPSTFDQAFGESLEAMLDLRSWQDTDDLSQLYERLASEVRAAVEQERRVREQFRAAVLPRLATAPSAPPGAGFHRVDEDELKQITEGLLFNGKVLASDASLNPFDTLPLTVVQVGVSTVAYYGSAHSWVRRLYRRDLRVRPDDPLEEALALLERRERREALDHPPRRDYLSRFATRAIAEYVERAILLERGEDCWLLGHGSPAPFELITGAGSRDLMVLGTRLVERLIAGHRRFVYVPSAPRHRLLQSLGHALLPLEYAIVQWLNDYLEPVFAHGQWAGRTTVDTTADGRRLTTTEWIQRFRDQITAQVVVGIYRATPAARAQVFYAHRDLAHVAARIALADSVLQWHRGFPLLLDLADHTCATLFGGQVLRDTVSTAYAAAGAPWEYFAERATRPWR
jgi:hypothetical protein